MSYYDTKPAYADQPISPAGVPQMSGPSQLPVKQGEYIHPAPPTYSQHFAGSPQASGSPPPMATAVPADGNTGHENREFYSPQPQQQQQYQPQPQYPQQAYGGAPPQQPMHTPSQQYNQVTPLYALSSSSAPAQCPSCNARTMTRTQLKSGNTTHAWALGLFLTTCCCCIPYFVSGTKDCEHRCGNCGILLATWHRSGRTEVMAHS